MNISIYSCNSTGYFLQALNASFELADAKNYQNIRVFTATKKTSSKAELDLLQIDEPWSKPNNGSLSPSLSLSLSLSPVSYTHLTLPTICRV